ncbi:hypothetical protein FO519_005751 [Halicephalobus sp. NKZ332]|nr:hypothetical protein FO519_005751 [Halicephalobus sp. NKZ332]
MSGLVGYQYDDSDEETRRNSTSKDDQSPESSKSSSPRTESMEVDKKEESPEVIVVESPVESRNPEKNQDPEEPRIPERVQNRSRSPLPQQMGYYEQMRQKGSPVPCSQEMMEKYELLFTQKARGISMDKYLDDIKTFKNPALYDLLLQKFDIETHGSNLSRNTKLFDLNDFEEHDYYDKLAAVQNTELQKSSKSKSHH